MMHVYRKLLRYVPKERYLAYVAIFLSVVSTLASVAAYFFLHRFLTHILVARDLAAGRHFAWWIAGLLAAGGIIYFVSVIVSHMLGFRLETNLRKRGIDGLTTASFRFYDLHPSGRTRKLIDDNAAQTHTIVAHLIPDNAKAVITPIAAIALGFYIDYKIGIALIVMLSFLIGVLRLMQGEKKFMEIYQAALERMSSETVEYVRGMPVIKIFGTRVDSFKTLYNAIKEYAQKTYDYSMSCKRPYVNFEWVFFGIVAFLIPLVLIFAGPAASAGVIAVHLIMTLFLAGILFASVMKIMYISMYAFQGRSAVDKLEAIFDAMQTDRLDFGDRTHFENFDITFDDVSFAYGEHPVFEHLNFTLEEGKTYALVGASGSGKSTLVKLISGFYNVDDGAIKIGGVPLTDYSEQAIIDNIAFVFQDVRLFKTTLYENVRLARRDASHDEVMEAMRLAGCDSILDKFPDREQTVIGSKGVYLSGGEKQRVAIARALLKDANIVIFDEASAAIDPDNEHELQKAFANLMAGRTVIMIAHRLSSIRDVDEILVLEDGRVVERGTDAELMQGDTEYKRLVNLYTQANEWKVTYA